MQGALRAKPHIERLAQACPASALRVVRALEDAGYEAWLVGGWVRDALLGIPSHDIDVTTSALWQESARVLRGAGLPVEEMGTAHGTVTAWVDDEPIEVTTYRVDGSYSDRRHPDEVRFVSDVREDLRRRDLTFNAMAWHPERGLLDPFCGCDDLAAGVVRTVGDPAVRFGEDALRMLRTVRFSVRLGYGVDKSTQHALDAQAADLSYVAPERMGRELDAIVCAGHAGRALLEQPAIMCAAIPELADARGFDQRSVYHVYDVYEHTVRVCNGVEAFTGGVASLRLRWAALLHDIGKPATLSLDEHNVGHFYGHPILGAIMAERIMKRLGLPGDLVKSSCALVRYHDHVIRPTARSMRRTLAMLEEADPGNAMPLAHELMDLKRADAVSKQFKCAWYAIELDEMDEILSATAALADAITSIGKTYEINPGDGPFYGPKLDFHIKDSLGRTWQCGTIQLDFQLPQNFELEYTGADGQKHRPIMIHRAGFGSFERFIGMLTEQYAGKFPTWLAPLQVKVLPVSEKTRDYALEVGEALKAAGIRVKVDERDEKIGYKIREARSVDRVPYMLILGEKERDAGNISVRDRTNKTHEAALEDFIADVTTEISERRG